LLLPPPPPPPPLSALARPSSFQDPNSARYNPPSLTWPLGFIIYLDPISVEVANFYEQVGDLPLFPTITNDHSKATHFVIDPKSDFAPFAHHLLRPESSSQRLVLLSWIEESLRNSSWESEEEFLFKLETPRSRGGQEVKDKGKGRERLVSRSVETSSTSRSFREKWTSSEKESLASFLAIEVNDPFSKDSNGLNGFDLYAKTD
ncbi:hypothetical protein BDY24DRAFT_433858, partial [Mrakia frigida]|uniref:uncharacterized protein n=1 Tax=Mrakia frigida TaxID=29902 RepID=UPI003FCC02D5